MYSKNTKIIDFDDLTKEDIKEHNPNWPQILDYPLEPQHWEKKFIV